MIDVESRWFAACLAIVIAVTIVDHANHEEPVIEPVKCPQVEQSTYGYTEPPKDKRIGHPLPPGPMKPSSWG